MKKKIRRIHLWLSVLLGIIISILCLSGAALVFENEITEALNHDFYYVEKAETAPLPVGELAKKVAATLPDSVSVTGISIPADPERAYQVNLSKPKRASVYIDPYTGEIKGNYERAPFFTTMFRLHRWLLDSMKPDGGIFWGKMIVGTSTLMFIFVLISGIVIWIPRTARALKNSLKISVNKGWRRFWYDLHIAGGVYTFLFLLVMSLTGLTWSFGWYRTGFYQVFGVETKKEHLKGRAERGDSEKPNRKESKKQSPYSSWQEVYEQLKTQNPGYRQITVSDGTATVSFNRLGNQRAADRYSFNPENGEITGTTLYKGLDKSGKIRGWIFSVHVGSWGGMFTRILSFIAALIGGTLPLTGYYLWIKREVGRSRRKKTSKQSSL